MKRIVFSAPQIKRYETDEFQPSGEPRFVAVSLKGMECHLQCDHCRTRMLSALYHTPTPDHFSTLCDQLAKKGCQGILITGGCDDDGTIPLTDFAEAAQKAKREHGFKMAIHTKLINRRFAEAAVLSNADLVMCDLVGDDKPLHEVYHLHDFTVKDVEVSLDVAREFGLRLAPHILICIDQGHVSGEYRALEMLEGRDFVVLALVVLTPLRHTPMADCSVDVPAVLQFLERARQKYPNARLSLGCAKVWGDSQRRFEEKALELGFDAIAYPSEGILSRAREMGYQTECSEMCCAFL